MVSRNKVIFFLFIAFILLSIIGFSLYSFLQTRNFANNGSSIIQDQIQKKIDQLQSDSLDQNKVINYLKGLDNKLTIQSQEISKKRISGIKFKLQGSATDVNLKYEKDSIFQYIFGAYVKKALINSLYTIDYALGNYAHEFPQSNFFKLFPLFNAGPADSTKNKVRAKKEYYLSELSQKFYAAFFQATMFNNPTNEAGYPAKYHKNEAIEKFSGFDQNYFDNALNTWLTGVNDVEDELREELSNMVADQAENKNSITKLSGEMDNINSLGRDKVLLTIALPVFSVLIVLLFSIPYIYKNVEVKDANNNTINILFEIFSGGLLLKIFTVFLLTICIVLLAIGDKIKGETIGTLLGGISVYILQNSFGNKDNGNGNNDERKETQPANR